MSLPEGVYTFDPDKEPSGPRASNEQLPGLTQANQAFDDGSANAAQQLTSQLNPYTQGAEPTLGQIAELLNQAQAPAAAPAQDAVAAENARLKQIIGDQGNQIGDLRKLLNSLAAQQQPQYQQVTAPPARLIPNRAPEDYPTAKEVEDSLYRAGEYLYGTLKAQMEESAAKAQLLAAGISGEEQQLLELQYPGIRNMDAQTRVGVISALVKSKRLEAAASTQANTQSTAQVVQQGVRQRVFVEQPQTVTTIPSAGAAIDVDAFGNIKSADQMAQQLAKLGVGRVNDIGRRG